jgi:hypothetical protein
MGLESALRETPAVIYLDNIKTKAEFNSTLLTRAITTKGVFSAREIGTSEMFHAVVQCLWLANGNYPKLSSEIARRTIPIRLRKKQDPDYQFQVDDLRAWLLLRRDIVIAALIHLIEQWLHSEEAPKVPRLVTFERWSVCVGGTLEATGWFDGQFLKAAHRPQTEEDRVWSSLWAVWPRIGGQDFAWQTPAQVLELVDTNALDWVGSEREPSAPKSRLNAIARQFRELASGGAPVGDHVVVEKRSVGGGRHRQYRPEPT